MKKQSSYFLSFLLFVLIIPGVFAKNVEWAEPTASKDFPFEFNIPSYLAITQNDLKEEQSWYLIISDNVNYTMTVYAWKGNPDIFLTEKDAAETGLANYTSITDKEILKKEDLITANGIKFNTIYGFGNSDNRKVFFFVTGFVIPRQDGSLDYCYVTFAWWDLPNENPYHKKLSKEILEKFKLGKDTQKQKPKWADKITWPEFHFEFQLPSFLKITQNDGPTEVSRYFSASDNVNYTISAYAWRESPEVLLNEKEVAQKGFENYSTIFDKEILSQKEFTTPSGIPFQMIHAVGKVNERKAYIYIAGFLIPNGGINEYCYFTFAWWDLPESNQAFEKISLEIIEKIKILEQQKNGAEGD